MKRLTLVTMILCVVPLSLLARAQTLPAVVGGPVELHNPHRIGSLGEVPGDATPPVTATTVPTQIAAVAMYAEGKYLFVVRGDSLFQFDKKTLRLLNAVQLPHPLVPTQSTLDHTSEVRPFASQSPRAVATSPSRP